MLIYNQTTVDSVAPLGRDIEALTLETVDLRG